MRLAVIGTSGTGKSTLARRVASKLGSKYIEQDKLFWLPNWQMTPRDQFAESILKETSAESWTICGNHSFVQEKIWARATHVVWLNYSLKTTLLRGFRRTAKRVFLRQECCNGNYESFRHAFLSKNSILWWIWTTHQQRIEQYVSAKREGKFDQLEFLEFKRPQEAEDWLKSVSPTSAKTIEDTKSDLHFQNLRSRVGPDISRREGDL